MTCASPAPTALMPRDPSRPAGFEPLLTAEQERRLAAAAARGDSAARDRLVRANLRLVVAFARRYAGAGMDMEDLVAEGNLGLIRAAARFDPARGVRFATCARLWIEEAIRSALTERSRAIRLPSHMVALLRRWRRAEAELAREGGPAPEFDRVAGRLGLGEARRRMVRLALGAEALGRGTGGEPGPLEWVADPATEAGAELERAESLAGLRERMARRLEPRERELLGLRFGLDGGGPRTLKEAAERLGVTREWARKLEARAVAKLRATNADA